MKVWITAFDNYLAEKQLPSVDEILTNNLLGALEDFYSENIKETTADGSTKYKNSTMKCIQAGINQYYKVSRSLDIILDPCFIQAIEIFKGIARVQKDEGFGEIDSYSSNLPKDFDELSVYFKSKMTGKPKMTGHPNTVVLQEIVVLNVIYYMAAEDVKT